jgi:hypothetical protein
VVVKPKKSTKATKSSELPKIDVTPEVKAELFRRRADTGRPCWQIADDLLRQQLGLRPRASAA